MDPSTRTMLTRGARRQCARCGSGGLFTSWFQMRESCPGCALRFEREPGYWLGAVAVNFAIAGVAFTVALVIALAFTVPDVPVTSVLALTLPIVVIGPPLTFRTSRTLWIAIDRAILQRLDR